MSARITRPPPPIALPGLTLHEEIGRGAWSTVYRATYGARTIALKVHAGTQDAGEALRRFRREAAIHASLRHPCVPEIYEVGVWEGRAYIASELVAGETLAERLEHGRFQARDVVALAITLADVLDAVHRQGVVHRDVKPKNILIAAGGALKLIDFGIAGQEIDARDVGVGTLRYSAPEQIGVLQRVVDGRADLYALGCVMFECITGRCPFGADNLSDLLHQHAAVRPERADAVEPRCPAPLADVIDRLLQKDPDDRYESAWALLAELRHLTPGASLPPLRDRESVMVGRRAELATLRDAVRAHVDRSVACVVDGPSGTGKTRLVEELLRAEMPPSTLVLRGKCVEGDPYPLAPIRAALGRWLRELRALPEGERARQVAGVREALGDRVGLLHPLGQELVTALGADGPVSVTREGREVFHLAAATLLQRVGAPGRAVLWIDDAQWLDNASREVLSALVAQAGEHPVVLLLTARSDEASAEALQSTRQAIAPMRPLSVSLGPLSQGDVAEMVQRALGQSPDEAFVAHVAARAAGNPLMVGQYLQAMKDAGVLRPAWGRWEVDREALASAPLPSSVFDLLLGRVSLLGERTREVLSVAALLGQQTTLEQLVACCENVPFKDVQRAVAEGAEARLIEPSASVDGFGFAHDRIREALVNAFAGDRARVHARAAEYLDALPDRSGRQVFERAWHAARAVGRFPARAAAHACLAAATLAVRDHAYAQAYELLQFVQQSGVAATLDDEPRRRFHRSAGVAAFHTERVGEAAEHFLRALELADRFERIDLRVLLARVAISRLDTRDAAREIAAAFEDLSCALPSATEPDPAALRAKLMARLQADLLAAQEPHAYATPDDRRVDQCLAGLCEVGFLIGYLSRDLMLAMQYGVLALAPACRLGAAREACGALATFCLLMGLLGKGELVARFSARALATARGLGDRQTLATTQSTCATALHLAGSVDDALRLQREVFELHGDWLGPVDYQTCCVDLAWNYYVRGYAREELAVSLAAIRRLEARGGGLMAGYICRAAASAMAAHAVLGRTHASLEYERRVEHLRAVVPADRAVPWVSVAGFRASTLLQRGEVGAPLDAVAAQHDAWGVPPARSPLHAKHFYVAHAYARYVALRRASGDGVAPALEACRAAVAALEEAASVPTLRAHLRVLQAALLVHEGDFSGAGAALDEARELAWTHDSPWVHYEETRVRARLLRARGLHAGARQQARAAWGIADAHEWIPRRLKVEAEFGLEAPRGEGARGPTPLHTQSTSSQRVLLRRQLDALLALSRASSSVLDPHEQARVALDESARILGAERAYLFVADEATGRPAFQRGRDATRADLSEPTGYSRSIVDRAFDTGRAQVLSTRDEANALGSESVIAYDLRSVLAAPLMAGDRVFGVLYLDNRLARGIFTEEHAELARAMGQHIVTALQTARAAQLETHLRSEQQRRRLAETLRALIAHLSSTLHLGESLERLADALARELRFDRCLIVVREDGRLETAVARGFSRVTLADFPSEELLERFRALEGPAEVAAADGDDREEPCLVLPLRSGGGMVGAVFLVRTDPRAHFDAADRELAITLASQVAVAIENARLFRRVRQLAEQDALTGVLNRGEFFRRAEEAHARGGAVIMFDVDHFKRFNDDHGHALGDEVLRRVAAAARSATRSSDIVGRYGGEEFSVLLPGATLEDARDVGERIRGAVAQVRIASQGADLSATVSVGVAAARPGETLQHLLSRADEALYLSKRRGRNIVTVQAHRDSDIAP